MWTKNARIFRPRPICLLCGSRSAAVSAVCDACDADLPRPERPCFQCGNEGAGDGRCGACLTDPPPFDRTIASFRYGQPISWLVQGFKFNEKLAYGRFLGDTLGDCIAAVEGLERPQALIPVPLHDRRQRSRGFNQSLELARIVARRHRLFVASDAVVRTRETEEQARLDLDGRERNMRGAFDVRLMPWRRVAIIDDVMTTGHTVSELAKSLKRAGCQQVQVWIAARASRPF